MHNFDVEHELKELYHSILHYGEIQEEAFLHLLQQMEQVSLRKGDIWVKPDDTKDLVGIQVSGLIRYYVINEGGQERTTDFSSTGEIVLTVENGISSSKWIQAIEDSQLCVMDRRIFEEAVSSDLQWQKLLRNLTEQCLSAKMEREAQLLLLDAPGKYELFVEQYGHLIQRIPQYLIASYLGISPVSLSRIRSERS